MEISRGQRIAMSRLATLVLFSSLVTFAQVTAESEASHRFPPVLKGEKKDSQNPPPKKQEPIEDNDEVIRVETNLVVIPVSVVDRYGRFLSGLRKEDFQIFEDNKPQKIEYFASVEQPFSVILLLDLSPSTRYKIEEIRNAAIAFTNQLRADDRVMVVAFDSKVRVLSPFTNSRSELYRAIMKTSFGNGTSLYEAVSFAIRKMQEIEGRKAIVLFTDGVDTTSKRAGYQDTLIEAEESDALIYVVRYDTYQDMLGNRHPTSPFPTRTGEIGDIIAIILGGVLSGSGGGSAGSAGSSAEEYAKGKRYLQELAFVSSGRYFEADTDLNTAFTNVAEELRRQYTLGYYPEDPGQPGQRKQIKVRISRPNVIVRAKSSYIVGKTSSKTSQPTTNQPSTQNRDVKIQTQNPPINNTRSQQEKTQRQPVRRPPF